MKNKKSYKCPKCGRHGGDGSIEFAIEGNIAGSMGVFTCKCGNIDASIQNCDYATDKDWEIFWKESIESGIMW